MRVSVDLEKLVRWVVQNARRESWMSPEFVLSPQELFDHLCEDQGVDSALVAKWSSDEAERLEKASRERKQNLAQP